VLKTENDIIRLVLPASFFAMAGLANLFIDAESVSICQNGEDLPNSCICLDSTVDIETIDGENLTSSR
jgi:hypothetical protein